MNEEHSKYEWLNLDEFVEKIDWDDNKEILSDMLKHKNSGKILDLGCGEGGFSLSLADKGFDVTCVDISKKAISEIKKEARKRKLKINVVCFDLENYKIKEDYDIILALGILQFLGEDGRRYLEKIQRHTKKGGINIINSFINRWLLKGKLKEMYYEWDIKDYEEYEQKLLQGGKKWMNYLFAIKRDLGFKKLKKIVG